LTQSLPPTTTKKLSQKSSSATMAPCLDKGLPCCGFRLRRRPSAFVSVSKYATNRTTDYIQIHQESVKSGIDGFEFAFRTPCTMKSLVIPAEMKLPCFDDDDKMPTTNSENRKNRQEYAGVRVNLNKLFDAVAYTPNQICSGSTCTETFSECCSRKS
jgi:hypothetical protein